MLDILEDFLSAAGYRYERIDGAQLWMHNACVLLCVAVCARVCVCVCVVKDTSQWLMHCCTFSRQGKGASSFPAL